jgi:hypothetical protein
MRNSKCDQAIVHLVPGLIVCHVRPLAKQYTRPFMAPVRVLG